MLQVRNNGPQAATNVQLTDNLPPGQPLDAASASQGTFTHAAANTLTFQLGNLPVGGSATVTLVFATAEVGSMTNTAAVTAQESDANINNNSVSQSFEITDRHTVFVTALYRDVLGRAPDSTGLASWVHALYSGVSQSIASRGFWESPEHRGLQVDQLYATYLHRGADAAGRAAWAEALLHGLPETEIARLFTLSPEYQAAHANNAAFVTGLYADVLQRAGDPTGIASWQAFLAAGGSRDFVVRAFLKSDEALTDTVDRYYMAYAHQHASTASERAWVTQLRTNFIGLDQLAEALLAADSQ
jgi:hypothetical protein